MKARVTARALLHDAFEQAMAEPGLDDARDDMPALTIQRASRPLAPAMLAASHPGDAGARAEMRAMYERCLAYYRQKADAEPGNPGVDDLGAAAACFVAANLAALREVDWTMPALLKLERQLARLLRSSTGWALLPARERQVLFEKLAILAVLVRETSVHAASQGPEAVDNVRRAARGYLVELLGLDPDHIQVGTDGLRVQLHATGA